MPGYRFEYAPTSRVKCKGPKPCAGTIIQIGSLRLGCTVEFNGRASFAWRHWGCVTTNLISNIKGPFPDASDVDGFEELKVEDQAKIIQAWKDGHVADEDSVSNLSLNRHLSLTRPRMISRSIFRGMKAVVWRERETLGRDAFQEFEEEKHEQKL
ncbi:zf-PARP-domain-containing protein [Gymnopus androsaceus JB14]|uniref:Zf-PARP-domain-containing protein n=1 Tax=Gymnopus androsaceus JB14 TaxID=1447944 RepID=A0A6A4GZV6_9AGAR|nr:zf-PARP-domain-containing protein [Gymnopus androsaceus JB14]